MKELFPENAVEYFVSYYDYYQPEAYIPTRATRTSTRTRSSTTQIDRMRHSATHALLSRRDVIIVASVSCIYGIGSAESYYGLLIDLESRRRVPARQALAHARRHPVRAKRRRLSPRHVPRARRRGRGLPRVRARDGDPHRVLRRHGRGDQRGRSPPRQGEGQRRALRHLPELALRDAAGADAPRDRLDPRGAPRAARLLRQGGALPREAAARAANALRPRDDGADGVLQRHRELLAPPLGPKGGRSAADAARLFPERLPLHRRRVAPDRPAALGDVPRRPRAQGDARRVRLSPA